MAFQPGQSGNPAGRPPGAKSKMSSELAEKMTQFLADDFDLFQADWKEIKPLERTKLRAQLYEYIMPKLSRGSMEVDISKLPDDEVERLLQIAVSKIASNELE